MGEFRKREGSDTWHFCGNCQHWPFQGKVAFSSSPSKPSWGELCNECRAKQDNGECAPSC